MATVAGLVLAVCFELLADGFGSTEVWGECRHVGRRRRGRSAEDALQNPDASNDWRRIYAIGRGGHDARMREDASATRVFQFDLTHESAPDVCGIVVVVTFGRVEIVMAVVAMLRGALVHEGVVGIDQLTDGAVVFQNAGKVEVCFLRHQRAQMTVEKVAVGSGPIGRHGSQLVEAQPVRNKTPGKGGGIFMIEHSLHLRPQHVGLFDFSVCGQREQLFIRHGRPEEVAQPAGELVAVQRSLGFVQVIEPRGREDGGVADSERLGTGESLR